MAKINCIELTGLNLDGALRRLHREGIRLKEVRRTSPRRMTMTVFCSSARLVAIFGESCYNLKILKSFELQSLLPSLLRRVGLVLGACLLMLAAGVYGGSVREIRIGGIAEITAEEVLAELEDIGIRIGSPRSGVVPSEVADRLVARLPLAAAATVRLRGVTLTVGLTERAHTAIEDTTPRDLIAKFSGEVTGVVVTSGTAAVKAGDRVTAGQVLIEGRIYEQDGSFTPVRAGGTVLGIVEKTYSELFECEIRTPYRTGRSESYSFLTLFSAEFPKVHGTAPGFSEFEEELSKSYLFPNMLLPFARVTVSRFELAYLTERVDFEKVRKYAVEEAEKRAREFAGGEVLGLELSVENEGTAKRIAFVIKVAEDFSGGVPFGE